MMEKCLERWMTSFSGRMPCVTDSHKFMSKSPTNWKALSSAWKRFCWFKYSFFWLYCFLSFSNIKSLQRRRLWIELLVLKYSSVGDISCSPEARQDYHSEMRQLLENTHSPKHQLVCPSAITPWFLPWLNQSVQSVLAGCVLLSLFSALGWDEDLPDGGTREEEVPGLPACRCTDKDERTSGLSPSVWDRLLAELSEVASSGEEGGAAEDHTPFFFWKRRRVLGWEKLPDVKGFSARGKLPKAEPDFQACRDVPMRSSQTGLSPQHCSPSELFSGNTAPPSAPTARTYQPKITSFGFFSGSCYLKRE